jgi:hypothetical protein
MLHFDADDGRSGALDDATDGAGIRIQKITIGVCRGER